MANLGPIGGGGCWRWRPREVKGLLRGNGLPRSHLLKRSRLVTRSNWTCFATDFPSAVLHPKLFPKRPCGKQRSAMATPAGAPALRGGPSVVSLPQGANQASSSWTRRIFGGKGKEREREQEAELAFLREEARNHSNRIHQLEASLNSGRAERDQLRRQLQECQNTLHFDRSQLATERHLRQTTDDRLRELELEHALQVSRLQHELDEVVRQQIDPLTNGRYGPVPDEQQGILESQEAARYEDRIRQERADREALQERYSRLADEAESLRKELEEKTKELSVKDQRLEWMQQRVAAFVHGEKSTP